MRRWTRSIPISARGILRARRAARSRLILKDSIVLDATINPDFSDVESDQPQFTVNQRYPVYFPELRPFFLENANYFSTPITAGLHAQHRASRIRRPGYGKNRTTPISAFLPSTIASPGRPSRRGDPLYGQARHLCGGTRLAGFGKGIEHRTHLYRRGVWPGLEPHRRHRLHARMNKQMDCAGANGGKLDKGQPRQRTRRPPIRAGPASDFQLQRSGHAFNLTSNYQDFSTGFQTQLGFIPDLELPQRPDSRDLSVVSEAQRDSELRPGNEPERRLRSPGQPRLSLLDLRSVPGCCRAISSLRPIVGQNSDTVGPQNGYLC